MAPDDITAAPLSSAMRLVPHSARAEQGLLGALLANNRAYETVAEFLLPHHFVDPLHGRIYAAIAKRVDASQVADPVTLRHLFANDAEMAEAPGGIAYLAELLQAVVGIISVPTYGRTILDNWIKRELIAAAEDLHNRCFIPGPEDTGMSILEDMEARLTQIAEGAGEVAPVTPAGEAVAQALEMTDAASKRENGLAGITTGYASLDRMISGLQPRKLVLLGARPSMGKTGLALGVAARAAADGTPTLFWSGEMGAEQLGARMGAAHAQLSTLSVFSGRKYEPHSDAEAKLLQLLDKLDWDRLVRGEKAAHKLPLFFDTRAAVSIQALRARARRMKRTHKLGLVVVDYVGLMRASAETERRPLYERMTEISKGLKAMAMELELPLLVCAQLNRQNESREDKTPQLSDLRESGSLEQDADVVAFIHRPHYYLSRQGEPTRREKETLEHFEDRAQVHRDLLNSQRGVAQIIVAKNRQGPAGVTRLRFQDFTTWFFDESEPEGAPAWQQSLMGGG